MEWRHWVYGIRARLRAILGTKRADQDIDALVVEDFAEIDDALGFALLLIGDDGGDFANSPLIDVADVADFAVGLPHVALSQRPAAARAVPNRA